MPLKQGSNVSVTKLPFQNKTDLHFELPGMQSFGRRNTQMNANERKRKSAKSAKECKMAQKSARERFCVRIANNHLV